MAEEESEHFERTGESEQQRLNRNMNELLQELRVSQTSVQILFAFLLAVPFAQRFKEVTTFQRDVYFIALLLAGLASALFIAPVATHRLLFRRQEKAYLIATSNWMAISGLVCVALAIVAVILLITDFLFSGVTAALVTAAFVLVFSFLWFVLPAYRLWRQLRTPDGD